MKANVKLGKIWGIPIGLNVSWFLIFALVTLSLSTGYFPSTYPELAGASALALGLLTGEAFDRIVRPEKMTCPQDPGSREAARPQNN